MSGFSYGGPIYYGGEVSRGFHPKSREPHGPYAPTAFYPLLGRPPMHSTAIWKHLVISKFHTVQLAKHPSTQNWPLRHKGGPNLWRESHRVHSGPVDIPNVGSSALPNYTFTMVPQEPRIALPLTPLTCRGNDPTKIPDSGPNYTTTERPVFPPHRGTFPIRTKTGTTPGAQAQHPPGVTPVRLGLRGHNPL